MKRRPHRRHLQRPAQGVVLLFTLLAMVIMLIGAVALTRSFNSSMFMMGNLAFKRDLVNQAERAVAVVVADLETGVLSNLADRADHVPARNYRAQRLPTNAQGIPTALLNTAEFTAVGMASNDIPVAGQGVTLRYVIDRLCSDIGAETVLGTAGCAVGPTPDARGGSASDPVVATQQPQVLYRISVRVDGPRSTQAFFQTTLAL
jgi:Tfp pilus assembly protein PilX